MPYKKGKFHCSKCNSEVHTPSTILCRKCYADKRRGIPLTDPVEAKNRKKEYKKSYFQQNKTRIYEKRKANPLPEERVRHYYIKSKYGISGDDYKQMLESRNFTCDICEYKQPLEASGKEKLYIDHCHKTGKVRGMLCFSCNTAIGHLKENIQTLNKAIKYLKNGKKISDD